MIWWILISFIFILLLWILLAPVILFTNTDRNRYSLSLPGVFQAVVVPADGLFKVRGWIFFVPYTFNPFKPRKKKKQEKAVKKKKKRIHRKLPIKPGMMKEALRAFRIKKLQLNMDTDDVVANSWLIPVFSLVNSENVQMKVNYEGTFSLLLDLRTRIGSLLWMFIKNKF